MAINQGKLQTSQSVMPNETIATRWQCCHMTICLNVIYSNWQIQANWQMKGPVSSTLD